MTVARRSVRPLINFPRHGTTRGWFVASGWGVPAPSDNNEKETDELEPD